MVDGGVSAEVGVAREADLYTGPDFSTGCMRCSRGLPQLSHLKPQFSALPHKSVHLLLAG